jgi:hypothetical protein
MKTKTPKAVFIRRRIILAIVFLLLALGVVYGVRKTVSLIQKRIEYSRVKVVEGRLATGQVLFDSLLENGVSREAANNIIASIGKVLDLTSLQVRDEYRVYYDHNNKIIKFIYEKSPIDQYFVVIDENGKFHSFKPTIYLDKETIAKEFVIKSSLFEAMLKEGEKDALVFKFVDVFAWDIDFYTYPRVGDKIKIYFEKYYKDGKFVKYGKILAAQYEGRDTFNAVYFNPKNNYAGYYTLEGKPAEKMFLKTPLKFTGRITSYFGWRKDPFTSSHSRHRGVDFAAYYGAPIVATSDGIVSFSGWKGAYGRLVNVRHSNGYVTYYGHCSKILVRPGQKVRQGQIIAKVGSTGRSTGPHCHYEIRLRNQAFNPLRFNQPKRKALAGKDLANFKTYSKKIWKNIEELKT